jgi:hypothetical protein
MPVRTPQVAIVTAFLACCHCGAPLAPSSSLVGDWAGRVAPAHFATLSIRFTQQGSTISGVACYEDPEGAADGKGVLFTGVPVTVNYPDITLENQSGSFRFWFDGHMTSGGSIQGQSGSAPGSGYPMSIERGGNYCGS